MICSKNGELVGRYLDAKSFQFETAGNWNVWTQVLLLPRSNSYLQVGDFPEPWIVSKNFCVGDIHVDFLSHALIHEPRPKTPLLHF